MARKFTTSPSLVFTRIVDRIRSQIEGAGEANCYLTLDPDSLPAVPGEFAYAVSPAPSAAFQQGRFDGGGNSQATVDWIIVITIHGLDQTDEEGRDTNFLTRSTRGIIDKWLEVATAISGHDLTASDFPGSDLILNQPLFPVDIAVERRTRRNGSMQFAVLATFDCEI